MAKEHEAHTQNQTGDADIEQGGLSGLGGRDGPASCDLDDVDIENFTHFQSSVYVEARRMLASAYLMFVVPDIRTLLRQKKLTNKGDDPTRFERLLNFPCTAYDVGVVYNDNLQTVQNTVINCDDRAALYNNTMDVSNPDYLKRIELLCIDDEQAEEECVYALSVNHPLKAVNVIFRGSVTTKDFVQDSKALLTRVANPLGVDPKELGLHLGFKEYLYEVAPWHEVLIPKALKKAASVSTEAVSSVTKKITNTDNAVSSAVSKGIESVTKKSAELSAAVTTSVGAVVGASSSKGAADAAAAAAEKTTSNKKSGDEENQKKDDEHEQQQKREKKYIIIMNQVKQVLAQYPDYKLYVGGHSLGGALATIFGFECAAAPDNEIPKPVTVITSGAPKVGNRNFLTAFESLEEERKIRCLRVANYRDIVTLSPPPGPLALCHAFCCNNQRFRHVGFRLKLTPHTFILSYPPRMRTCLGMFIFDFIKLIKHYFFVLVFLPLVACCSCKTKRFLRAEHTQLVYMNRFDLQKDRLGTMSLDELYEERFARAKWRLPVLHVGAHAKSIDEAGTAGGE